MTHEALSPTKSSERRLRAPRVTSSERIFVLANGRPHQRQGHDLLASYLGAHSEQLRSWQATTLQKALAIYLRRIRPYSRLSPRNAYTLFRADSYLRAQRKGGLIHLLWGDELIEHVRRPESCIFTLHQPYETWTAAAWSQIASSAGIICMAERECAEIWRREPTIPCVFIPHGVDVEFWRPQSEKPLRQICAVGRYLRNFEMFLRVARVILERHRDVTFQWVVNPDFTLSAEMISQLPPQRFHLLRNLTPIDLRRLYSESWLFCMPYENVTASNAIVEAMASGTPVFTTRVGGMPSYAGDDAITMVPNNDDDAMVAAVSQCLTCPEIRESLSARARRHAQTHFSWPIVAAAHERFYCQLLEA